MPRSSAPALASAAILLSLSLAACQPAATEPSGPPPPPEVGFITARSRSVALVRELPGRIAPTRVADVRARVGGLVVKRNFEQGSHVSEGDPLYQIDPSAYRAEVESAEAEVARAEANLVLAKQQAERLETLQRTQIASKAQYETAFAALKSAEASLAGARASRTRARLNLDYTTVRAPISGRIGRALLTEGALIEQGSTTASLAVIQQLDPVYVDITQSVGELRRLRRDLASGELSRIAPDVATVRLMLEDGEMYGRSGRLLFSEVTADPSTGQVTLRVEVPNPNDDLFPGMYVRARIEQAIDQDAITVPQAAVQRSSEGLPELYVLDGEDRAVARRVELGDVVEGQWVVRDGIAVGDRVVVDGFQRLALGQKVRPLPVGDGRPHSAAATAPSDPSGSAGATSPSGATGPSGATNSTGGPATAASATRG